MAAAVFGGIRVVGQNQNQAHFGVHHSETYVEDSEGESSVSSTSSAPPAGEASDGDEVEMVEINNAPREGRALTERTSRNPTGSAEERVPIFVRRRSNSDAALDRMRIEVPEGTLPVGEGMETNSKKKRGKKGKENGKSEEDGGSKQKRTEKAGGSIRGGTKVAPSDGSEDGDEKGGKHLKNDRSKGDESLSGDTPLVVNSLKRKKSSKSEFNWKAMSRREMVRVVFEEPSSCKLAKTINVFVITLIFVSTFSFIIESLPVFYQMQLDAERANTFTFWWYIEVVVVVCFTLEYVIRFSVSEKKWIFFKRFLNLVDLLAVLPFYIETILDFALRSTNANGDSVSALRVLRAIRLVRVFRIFKLSRYSKSMNLFAYAIINSISALQVFLVYLAITVILFSSVIFFAERGDYDETLGVWINVDGGVSAFQSIPHSMWWCVVTLVTVGYGDDVTITPIGKAIATVTMLCGLIVIAMPLSVLGASFNQIWFSDDDDGDGEQSNGASSPAPPPTKFGIPGSAKGRGGAVGRSHGSEVEPEQMRRGSVTRAVHPAMRRSSITSLAPDSPSAKYAAGTKPHSKHHHHTTNTKRNRSMRSSGYNSDTSVVAPLTSAYFLQAPSIRDGGHGGNDCVSLDDLEGVLDGFEQQMQQALGAVRYASTARQLYSDENIPNVAPQKIERRVMNDRSVVEEGGSAMARRRVSSGENAAYMAGGSERLPASPSYPRAFPPTPHQSPHLSELHISIELHRACNIVQSDFDVVRSLLHRLRDSVRARRKRGGVVNARENKSGQPRGGGRKGSVMETVDEGKKGEEEKESSTTDHGKISTEMEDVEPPSAVEETLKN